MEIFEKTINCAKKCLTENEKLTKDLGSLKDEIQAHVKSQKQYGSFWALNGIISGVIILGGVICSPASGGSSVFVSYGAMYGIATGGLDIITGVRFTLLVQNKLTNAKELLETHAETLGKMYEHLKQLKKYMKMVAKHIKDIEKKTSKAEKVFQKTVEKFVKIGIKATSDELKLYKFIKLRKPLRKLLSRIAKGTPKEAAKVAAKEAAKGTAKEIAKNGSKRLSNEIMALGIAAILLDLKTYLSNQNDLDRFKKGRLCAEAAILERAIDNLKDEYEAITEYLKTTTAAHGYTESSKTVDAYMQASKQKYTSQIKRSLSCLDIS